MTVPANDAHILCHDCESNLPLHPQSKRDLHFVVTPLTSGCDSVEVVLVYVAESNSGHTRSLLVTRGHPKTPEIEWSSGEQYSHPTGVVVQTPVWVWLKWIERLAKYVKRNE